MKGDVINPETLSVIEDSVGFLDQSRASFFALSNSLGTSLTDLDCEDLNQEVQSALEGILTGIGTVQEALKKVLLEKHEEIDELNTK